MFKNQISFNLMGKYKKSTDKPSETIDTDVSSCDRTNIRKRRKYSKEFAVDKSLEKTFVCDEIPNPTTRVSKGKKFSSALGGCISVIAIMLMLIVIINVGFETHWNADFWMILVRVLSVLALTGLVSSFFNYFTFRVFDKMIARRIQSGDKPPFSFKLVYFVIKVVLVLVLFCFLLRISYGFFPDEFI